MIEISPKIHISSSTRSDKFTYDVERKVFKCMRCFSVDLKIVKENIILTFFWNR
jgi:hypothetical protein